ncbi:nitroreductase [Paralcaligenes sp. KSB-10]|uniref:nitroreductase family protein n=1 Tax=Paralcaligenes sp. KSB-10 TaxID=2901142 RepID=UPI001E34687E|nr:nitroreductase family protein [Paralcaligenes sp. KSB-10]UHL62616.1 nitroreductase [Paralcaligenes sp. KSB-10]
MDTFEIIEDAITSRKSVRGFLPKAIDMSLVERILAAAAYAPSGSNIQPWKVHVVTGSKRDELSSALVEAHDRKIPENREYQYYPVAWRSPYIERRRETGWGLYGTLGIQKGDKDAMARQHGKNFLFFGAPVVLIFTIDNDLEKGSWLDYGMFLQNIMVLARGAGLHTCPQAAIANYPGIVKEALGISDSQTLVCGISMGYEDSGCVANQFRTRRMDLDEFVTFCA